MVWRAGLPTSPRPLPRPTLGITAHTWQVVAVAGLQVVAVVGQAVVIPLMNHQ